MSRITGILAKLKGGDRRSIGKADEVARAVAKNPKLFAELISGFLDPDPLIRMRSADAVEKITRDHPELLGPWKRLILDSASTMQSKELRWHAAQLLPRLSLTPAEQTEALAILHNYLNDKSSIVKTFGMQALVDIATHPSANDDLRAEITPLIERLTRTGTPAMKARGRKLLKVLRVTP
jgi:HEAT repeat protein